MFIYCPVRESKLERSDLEAHAISMSIMETEKIVTNINVIHLTTTYVLFYLLFI